MPNLLQTGLNALKSSLNAVLFGASAPLKNPQIDAEPAATRASSDTAAQQLSALGHMQIPPTDDPGEGWVFVGNGEKRRADRLTDYERQREDLLQPIARRHIELYLALAKLRHDTNGVFDTLEEMQTGRNSSRKKAGKKPSLTLQLLDGSVRIARTRADRVRYEQDKLLQAKMLIEQRIGQLEGDSQNELKQMVGIAFRVNKAGQYSRAEMSKLKKVESDSPLWKEAMEIITDAEQPDGVASYLLASVRDVADKYHPLPLDIAAVREWPGAAPAVFATPVRPIRTALDYQEAMAEIKQLMALDPPADTPDGDRLELLAQLAEAWEIQHSARA